MQCWRRCFAWPQLDAGKAGRFAASDYVPVTEFDPARDAAQDIATTAAEAKRSGRRVLLDVGGERCIWCHKLDEFFKKNPDVAELLHANYVAVKVNFSPENENEAVLSRYAEIAGYPHFFVLDHAGGGLAFAEYRGSGRRGSSRPGIDDDVLAGVGT